MINEAYAELLGSSLEEARRYEDQVLAAERLDAEMKTSIPNEYGGMRILPSKNFKVQVYLKANGNIARDLLARFTSDSA